MSDKTHYFLAVQLPENIKNDLNHSKSHFQEYLSFQRWVHQADYHITLAFLGFATQNQLKEVEKLVSNQIREEKDFLLEISHLGTFGMKTSPRIFWAGLNKSTELDTLRDKVFYACEQAGFELEKRPFHPHITLARKWSSEESFHSSLLEKSNLFLENPLSFQATNVVLYKTNLLQTPKYENLITFSLQS
ncbi:RNA 2',3'-cyclic phosphodiesterase [Neobacillus sp. D3-1R]|uniref:RNA 2',3'-cyclic phosphodiesterase n=1 Tax=Neobacillus sp. D3-1R TaxID=3445778 RepID=UPI003FA0CEED